MDRRLTLSDVITLVLIPIGSGAYIAMKLLEVGNFTGALYTILVAAVIEGILIVVIVVALQLLGSD